MNAPTLMPLAPTLNAQPMGDAINTFGTAGKAAGALADAFNSAALTIGKSAADVATKTTAGLPFFASLGATTGSADALSTALRNAADAAAASALASSTVGSLDLNKAASAIKAIESLGSGGYSAVGPTTKSGDNAYGAYQVMGENVGPWSKKWTGAEMTPGQFLKDPTAQDAVFTGQFSALVQKFGNVADAVSAWFTGKPLAQGANKSDGYTTGSQYVAKFQKYYGQDASGSASNDNSARSQVANSLDSAQAKGLAQVDIEFYDNKVKTLNLDLDKQKAALGLVRDAFGQSADAVATASKAQDLFNQFESQGVKLTSDQKQALTELAAKFAEVAKATKEAQQANADYIKGMDSVRGLVGGSATSFLTGLAQGNKPKDLLKSMLGNVESQGIGSAVGSISDLVFGQKGTTGSDTIGGAIFGKADSIGKSLFDGIAGAFGFGGGKSASTQQMTVNASTVNVSGGLAGGASGLLGGGTNGGALLGSLGSLFNGGASSSLSSAGSGIGGFFSSIMSALPFAEGGVMTSAGPVPLRAYAAGGVATSPQMSLFGEGGTPEAYVPLRDGRTIPVSLQGGGGGGNGGTSVSVHNYAGVDIEPRVTAGHVELIVGKRVAQAMAQVPTMMQDYQRRTA
jgi:hypothetical protein